ncbi:hypothetical protein [Natronoglomus mannanivorans]|uniref:Uncharacterized protein n=1 Tax=Natronoglomus mannanivorans TaxID=2979990 RepID=A0AAP2Z2U6_9EURY|nr:hypothetical protein [Halobacteria archaeon AArc-xg1-1]
MAGDESATSVKTDEQSLRKADLPTEIRDIANPLATVAPHMSQFVVRVRPDRPIHLRYFQTFGLAEEMMHGRRHQFGLTRSHHLLRMRSLRALFDHLNEDISLETAAMRITTAEDAIQKLHEERVSFLEGVDKYLCQSVMSEEGYLDRHIDQYLSLNSEPNRETVEDRFEQLREHLDERAQEEASEVYDMLAELEANYGRRVTEVVADAALDTPYLVGPHEIDGFEAIPAEELDLKSRFDAAVNAVRAIDPSDIDEDSTQELLAEVGDDLSDPFRGSGATHPRELDLPLLDIPQSIDSSDALRNKYDVILEAPTEIGQILNAAFRFKGNFGGAIYQIETQDGVYPNWQVNPLIADKEIPDGALGIPVRSVESYKELWEWVYFGSKILDGLLVMVGRRTTVSIECPLCGVSMNGTCHPDGCPSAHLVDKVKNNKTRIVPALEDLV